MRIKSCRCKKKLNPLLKKDSEALYIEKYNALLRFYFKINPPEDMDEWKREVQRLQFALKFNAEYQSTPGKIILP
jgi:hypothetical protein